MNSDNRYKSTVASLNRREGGEMMKKLFVLGMVALMVMGMAVMAHGYAVSVTAVAPGAASAYELDLGDYATPAAGDSPYNAGEGTINICSPDARGDEVIATDLNHAATGTSPNYSVAPWYFYVWSSGPTANNSLTAFLTDDGTAGIYGGSVCGLNKWVVTDVTKGTTVATFNFTGLADTSFDYTDANAFSLGNVTVGTSRATAEEFSIKEVGTPEPGSMVALFSGLVGLVGYGIRRRK
jgi:hypothetical protein